MNGTTFAGLMLALVLIGAATGYLYGTSSRQVVTSELTSTSTAYVVSATTVPSLELLAKLSPSSPLVGQNITISGEVYNPTSLNVTAETMSFTNPVFGPCGQEFATSVNVYVGHLTFENVTASTPLLLYGPGAYTCPPVGTFQYIFGPHSAVATIQAAVGGLTGKPVFKLVNETSMIHGYWSVGSNSTFQDFQPGPYTVVVEDAWGQQLIEYFFVTRL